LKPEAGMPSKRITALLAKLSLFFFGCPECGGTGIEYSGCCHCGISMEGHSDWDNHSALEMTRPCQTCTAPVEKDLEDYWDSWLKNDEA